MKLAEALRVLKFGTSNKNYPFYAPYINSDGAYLKTFNNDVFVKVSCEAGFVGSVSYFVLSDLIKTLSSEEINMNQVDSNLIIETQNSKTTITILDLEFPEIVEPDSEGGELTEETYSLLDKASYFTGDGTLEHVYFSQDCICGSSFNSMFYSEYEHGIELSKPLGLSKQAIKFLSPNILLSEDNSNLVIRFQDGYLIMSSFLVDNYPIGKIKKFIGGTLDGKVSIINAAPIIDSLKYILPILHGESSQIVTFTNLPESKTLCISAVSRTNGKSVYKFESETDVAFNFTMDASNLKKLDFGYSMRYNPKYKDRIVFEDDKSVMVFLEERG
jgi:hypothetical protein